jgi:dTDP-4-dehydrorhamnose 3,5-epimerase-like enzyme
LSDQPIAVQEPPALSPPSPGGRGGIYYGNCPEHLPSRQNVHVVVTESGHVRGNHYHPRGTEVLTVQGPALVRIRDELGIWDTMIPEGAALRFIIPPGICHASQNLGSRPTLLVAFRDLAHHPADLTWCAMS